jgi:hypothetical protein
VVLWLLAAEAQWQAETRRATPGAPEAVDWAAGVVRGQARAPVPTLGGAAAARRTAALTLAVQAARQRLLETLARLRLNAERSVGDLLREAPEKQQALAALVAEAEVVEVRYLPQETVESTVQLPVFGRLTALLWPETRPVVAAAEPAGAAVYTGVVIDARGLALQPALFPRLVDEQGQALYTPLQVDAAVAAQRGYVAYASTADSPQMELRIGKQPLVLRARRALAPARVDVVMGHADADQLQHSEALQLLLRQCRVVILG